MQYGLKQKQRQRLSGLTFDASPLCELVVLDLIKSVMYSLFPTGDADRDSPNSDDEPEVDQNTNKLGIFLLYVLFGKIRVDFVTTPAYQ